MESRGEHPYRGLIGSSVALVVVVGALGVRVWNEEAGTTAPTTTAAVSVTEAASTTSTSMLAATTVPVPTYPDGMLPVPEDVEMPLSEQFAGVQLRVEPVLDIANLTGIVWSVRHEAYYAITQDGTLLRIPEALDAAEVVLDLTARVTPLAPNSERGLLGIAFDPRDGRMFLYLTDVAGDTNVVSYALVDGVPDIASERLVLTQEQPGPGHKAGDLNFDAAGRLYVGLGDGGGSRGRDAQDYSTVLGSIIRIIPRLDEPGYDIPPDNPFVDRPDVAPELWAKGLRNPWQFSINAANGDIWLGDVGENDTEEVNRIPAGTSGQNFGWFFFEGEMRRDTPESLPADTEFTLPVYAYPHTVGPAVIGGFVYHGSSLPSARGAYVFADMTGLLFIMGRDTAVRLDMRIKGTLTSFAETPERELLITSLRGGLMRIVAG